MVEFPTSEPDARHWIDRRDFLKVMTLGTGGLLLGLLPVGEAHHRYSLEYRVESLVKKMRRQGIIRPEERTSWSVYDFTADKKLVSINEDVPRQTASMIKPFVAQAYFFLAKHYRRVRYTAEIRRVMERMIRWSSNTATNYLIDQISRKTWDRGPQDVERVLKKYAPGVFQQIRIVEKIPPGGRTYHNLASAHDYSRFLYALWYDQLPYAGELRQLMALPNRNRITDGVHAIPASVHVYDKTGSTARLCGNMGIVAAPGRHGGIYPYTFIAIIERPTRAKYYRAWLKRRSNAIRQVSQLVYLDMKSRHQLV